MQLPRLLALLSLAVAAIAAAGGAAAQGGRFAPRVTVNDKVVTNYEVEQRVAFMNILNAPVSGDPEAAAVDALIEDRLRLEAGERADVAITDKQLAAGMKEFAGRANLDTEEFIRAIGQGGVAAATFRDFVHAGLVWRQVVRARFGRRSQVTGAEIDRAVALGGAGGEARVLLSQIVLPADTDAREAKARKLAARLSREISGPTAFARAARRYSAASSAGRGGRMQWVPLSNLPPQLSSIVLTLAPGEVSAPVPLDGAVALFQLRAIEEAGAGASAAQSLDYARYVLPGGTRQDAAALRARIDTCDDLYGVAKGQPPERLTRQTRPASELPERLSTRLAGLDANEIATMTVPGGAELVMLCARNAGGEPDRDAVRGRLRNRKLAAFARNYLAELRADAIIRRE